MSKLKAFFHIFSKSLTSLAYYKDVVSSDKKLSIKYFFSLALLATLVTSIYTLIPLVPKVRSSLSNAVEQVVSMYDDDLVVTIAGGKLSTNRTEPYVVPAPWKEEVPGEMPENLVVIDVNGTVDDFNNKYDSFILVNASNIMFHDSSGMRVESLSQFPDMVVTKGDVLDLATKAKSVFVYVPYLLSVFLFIGLFLNYAFLRFLYLFVVAALLFVIGRLRGVTYSYIDYLKIAIHTFTLPLVLEVIVRAVDISLLERFPMWFLLVNMIFGVVVLFSLPKDSVKLIKKSD
ncbi:MAG: DUF1189 family protein [Patescibacteria group bacterium]|jgi:hypothetical protein